MASHVTVIVVCIALITTPAHCQTLAQILGNLGGTPGDTSGTATAGTSGTGGSINTVGGSLSGGSGGSTVGGSFTAGSSGPSIQLGSLPMSQNPAYANVQPFCTPAERRLLFNNCAMSFGIAHRRYFQFLASQQTCRAEVFDCGVTDNFVRCVNSQPVSQVSNQCWLMVRDVLSSFLQSYRLPCTFQDIYNQCSSRSQDILPIEQRPQSGLGVDTNPMSFFMDIFRRVAPMIAMMMSGGMGGMLAF